MSTTITLLRKDLLLERRTLETIPAMVLLSLSTFIIFHFGIGRDQMSGQLAAGVLTVTLLFSAMLGINRLFVAEREQGGFDAFLLAPVDRTAMLTAKVIAMLVYLLILELVAIPAFAIFLDPPHLGSSLPALILFLLLVDIAFAVIGTFVSALAINTRARDLIGPVIGLPLMLPALIATALGIGPLLTRHASGTPDLKWIAVLGLYDVLNALLAFAVFDFLLED
jgi:heme exporter protein B